MSEKKIKSEYQKKIKLLQKHNLLYYDKSNPKISDKDYDNLKEEILKLEKQYNFLNDSNSPSKTVGFKPSRNFKKSAHREKMLSLSNAFDEEDLVNFEKKICNYLNLDKNKSFEYSVEPKIDGISASLTYKNGRLLSGLSRGDGEIGELITENLKTINDIPQKIKHKDFPDDIDIRGEVFITNKDFEKLKDKFANARNAASGSLRQKDPGQTKKIPLRFIAYSFGYFDSNFFKKQSDFIFSLSKWGFKTSQFNKVITGVQELTKNHENFEKKRFDIEYDTDGLVYKVNDLKLQSRLGNVANAPRWAIAHKFSAKSSTTIIEKIEIQVGRTGALTPVAKVKPVNIGGVVVSNASLHNEDEINRKDIRVGDTVKIERAGDVIPHVISVDKNLRPKNSKKYIFPNQCPSCGRKIVKEFNTLTKKFDAVKRCPAEGYECDKISVEKIKHFISKDALNIDGLGKKVVENFWDLKMIRTPFDIYNLDYDKIKNLEGWGDLSVSNLKFSIEKSKNTTIDKLIYSLGIRHIGQESAKLISNTIKNIDNLLKIDNTYDFDILLNTDGIGDTQIKSLRSFFSNKVNLEIISKLAKVMKIKNLVKNKNGKLKNKSFLITGKLEGISRAEIKSIIEQNAGKILSSVNSKLDYLITGDNPTKNKLIKAKELKIKVLDQNDFNQLLK